MNDQFWLIRGMGLVYKLELVCILVQGGRQVCEQGLDGRQVQVYAQELGDTQGQVCEQELDDMELVCEWERELHNPHMIRPQCIQCSGQKYILHFDAYHRGAKQSNVLLQDFRQNLQLLQSLFQYTRRLHRTHNDKDWVRILVHDKKELVYMMAQERGKRVAQQGWQRRQQ